MKDIKKVLPALGKQLCVRILKAGRGVRSRVENGGSSIFPGGHFLPIFSYFLRVWRAEENLGEWQSNSSIKKTALPGCAKYSSS